LGISPEPTPEKVMRHFWIGTYADGWSEPTMRIVFLSESQSVKVANY
jgi:hypothetical protein